MKRRTFLAGAAGSSQLATVGCLGSAPVLRSDDPAPEITDVEFETGVTDAPSYGDDPAVASEDGSVRVSGTYAVRAPCYEPYLPEPAYYEGRDLLVISPSQRRTGAEACTDRVEFVPYRVIAAIDGAAPGTLRVNETLGGTTSVELR